MFNKILPRCSRKPARVSPTYHFSGAMDGPAVVRYSVTIRYTIAHYGTVSPSFLPSALYHPLTSVYSPFVSILPYIWCISTLYSVLPFGSHISSLWSAIVLVSVVFPLVPSFPPLSVYYPLALTYPPFGRPKSLPPLLNPLSSLILSLKFQRGAPKKTNCNHF